MGLELWMGILPERRSRTCTRNPYRASVAWPALMNFLEGVRMSFVCQHRINRMSCSPEFSILEIATRRKLSGWTN